MAGERSAKTWVVRSLVVLGIALVLIPVVAFAVGRLHYAQIRADNGDMRLCVLGFAYEGGEDGDWPLGRALAAVARIPPTIRPKWYTVESEPELSDVESNPRYMWLRIYQEAAAWTQVDPRIARWVVGDLAVAVRSRPGRMPEVNGTILREFSRPMELNESAFRYEVVPGWLHREFARQYLDDMGYDPGRADLELPGDVLADLGWTPLHWHALAGEALTVWADLGAGADVNAENLAGYRPVHLAAQLGHADVLGVLLESRADPEARGGAGWTPLMCAAGNGWEDSTRLLLERGADPNATDDRGRTALHLGARSGSVSAVEVLLAAGADPAMRDNDGHTPLDMATWPHRNEAAALLERQMPVGHCLRALRVAGSTRTATDDGRRPTAPAVNA